MTGSSRAGSSGQARLRNLGLVAFVFLLSGILAPVPMKGGDNVARSAIELRIIVVSSQTEAEQLIQRLKTGEDFAVLARQRSIDPSASDGGFLGRMDPESLRTELRDVLKGALPGQIKGPVKIPTGYAILRVEGAAPGPSPTPI